MAVAQEEREEVVLKGIQPKNQVAYKIYKGLLWVAGGFGFFGALILGLSFISVFKPILSKMPLKLVILILALVALTCVFFALVVKKIFLRKPPFDDWVFDIARKILGTEVIFYTSKYLYIHYDVTGQVINHDEFVQEMTEKSLHYSYFLISSFIDQRVLQVECVRKQVIPEMARLKPKEDDKFWNIIPIGLSVNNITQKVAPLGWYLNDQNISEEMIDLTPSNNILICGGTGCFGAGTKVKVRSILKEAKW